MLRVAAFRQAYLQRSGAGPIDAVVKGVRASGDSCCYTEELSSGYDVALHTSGVKALKNSPLVEARRYLAEHYQERRLVVESRCFRQNAGPGEERYWRLSLGGFLYDEATYHPAGFVAPADRWDRVEEEQGIELKVPTIGPDGGHILLTAQKPSDASLRGKDVQEWVTETIAELRKYTDRLIAVRPHPLSRERIRLESGRNETLVPEEETLERSLLGTWALVTHTSLSAIEAVCEGVPTIVTSSGNLAWPVAGKCISEIESPGEFIPTEDQRLTWLRLLAYCQWTLDELREGKPWRRLRKVLMARTGLGTGTADSTDETSPE